MREAKDPPRREPVTSSATQSACDGSATLSPTITVDCGAPARSTRAKPPVRSAGLGGAATAVPRGQQSNAFRTLASMAAASKTPAI